MVLGILGSASKDSTTREALRAVQDRLVSAGRSFDLLDLAVEYRDLHDLAQFANPDEDGQTALLRRRVAEADAVVLATPVYHGSFSALLKNALDHLLSDAFAGRPVGLIANGGGPRSGGIACEQLRSVVRALGGWSTPTHVAISGGDFADGVPDPLVAGRLDALVAELCAFPVLRAAA
jgi:NAD(P)H-dependent FMN reductase